MSESYYVLEIKYSDKPAETRKFTERLVVIGRESGDIVLGDNQSSGRHAELQFVNGKLTVKDLGSTNGVIFNGARTPQFAVNPGQAFICGQTTLVVREIKGPSQAFGGGRTMIGLGAPSMGGMPMGGAPPPGGGMRPPMGGAPPPGGGMRPPMGGAPPPGGGVRPPMGDAATPSATPQPDVTTKDPASITPVGGSESAPKLAVSNPAPAAPASPLVGGPVGVQTPVGGVSMQRTDDPALAATGIAPPEQRMAPAPTPAPAPSMEPVGVDFRGSGGEMLRTLLPHALLCIPTAGIYAPWLSVRARRYEAERTVVEPTARGPMTVAFEGTGGQLFVLMLKGILVPLTAGIYGAWYIAGIIRWSLNNLVFTAGDGTRYRLRFSATGGDLIGPLILGGLLTAITAGIYGAWFQCSLRKLLYTHIQVIENDSEVVGQLDFAGTGGKLFVTALKGMFLSMITAGIYFAWFGVSLRKFFWGHTRLTFASGTRVASFNGTGGQLFVLALKAILIPLTLGIYLPWWLVAKIRFELNNLKFAPESTS